MIHMNPELRDALAAEYVLGTQSRLVRNRMTRLIEQDSQLADRVRFWESHLAEIAESVSPVPAPPWLWQRIENRLNPASEPRTSWWNNALVWRWSTVMAGALALILALLPPPVQRPDAMTAEGGVVLVLTDDESRTAWLVSRRSADEPIRAQPLALPVLTEEQAYELWLLPPDGVPMSVGLLADDQQTELTLDEQIKALLQPGVGMAVSLEPPGGSPTGAPTGPVVFTGSILEL